MSNWSKFLEKFKVEDFTMKTHKIPGVEKSVCTAEQKIAYNLTFANYYYHRDRFNNLPTEMAKSQAVNDLREHWLNLYRLGRSYTGKYNEDAIAVALNQGIRSYMENPFIAGSYEEIGECFKIPYAV